VVFVIPTILFSCLVTASSLLHLLYPCWYWVVGHIVLGVTVITGEYSARSCNSCRLCYLEISSGLEDSGRNFQCSMGATQPIGIFLAPPFSKSMQLCGFDILSPSHNSTRVCAGSSFNAFHYSLCNRSPPVLPLLPCLANQCWNR